MSRQHLHPLFKLQRKTLPARICGRARGVDWVTGTDHETRVGVALYTHSHLYMILFRSPEVPTA